jgi:hypothetical protein
MINLVLGKLSKNKIKIFKSGCSSSYFFVKTRFKNKIFKPKTQ